MFACDKMQDNGSRIKFRTIQNLPNHLNRFNEIIDKFLI